MTKFFTFRSVRAAITAGLTFATVALWNVAAHAAEPTFHETAKGSYGTTVNGHKVVFALNSGKGTQGYWTTSDLVPAGKVKAAIGYHPLGAAKGNPPSAARAQMARYNVPGGCVVTLDFKADGSIVRHSYCEYSPALLSRLATTGK